jgi:DNA-binding NarL/FixJ family response regulator
LKEKRTSILIVEDHVFVREGLRKILEGEKDFDVLGEAQDGREAVVLAKKFQPEIVLMDFSLPRLNGLESTRQILKALPNTKVLILSAHSHDKYIKDSIAAGAVGFLVKHASAREVCRVIRHVCRGKLFFRGLLSPSPNRDHRQLSGHGKISKPKAKQLSSREVEVLQLVAEGKKNKETAMELGIGMKTVEKHRANLMQKLDIHDTAGLTRYALKSCVIEGKPD